MKSTSAFSGDILLSERDDVGNLYLVVGDFTGHGLSAAMGTLPVAMIFFKMVKEKATIAEIAREFNKQLYQFMPSEMFFAATLIKLDKQNNTMTVWIGGMPECYWLTQYGELKKVIPSQYLPLGILNDNDFNETPEIYHINKDDKVYLYSDGVIEAQNAEGKMFGSERFKEIVVSQQDNLFDQVLNEFKDFTYNVEPKDDITLVELTCYDQIEGFLCK